MGNAENTGLSLCKVFHDLHGEPFTGQNTVQAGTFQTPTAPEKRFSSGNILETCRDLQSGRGG